MDQMLDNVCSPLVCHLRLLQGVISGSVWGQRRWSADAEDGGSGEEVVSDQNIDFEDTENDSFKNTFEITNMSQMLNVLGK